MYKSVHLEIYFHLNIDVGKWEFFSSFFLKFPTEADNSANFNSQGIVFVWKTFFSFKTRSLATSGIRFCFMMQVED